jgi:tetratricopeptide (TPR) repeat protein
MSELDDVFLMTLARRVAEDPASWGTIREQIRQPKNIAALIASGQIIDFARAIGSEAPLSSEPLGFLVGALYLEAVREVELLATNPREMIRRVEEVFAEGMPRPPGIDGVATLMPGQTPFYGIRILAEPLDDPRFWPIFVDVCGHVIEDSEAILARDRRQQGLMGALARRMSWLVGRGPEMPREQCNPATLLLTEVGAFVNRAEKFEAMGRVEEANADLDAAIAVFARITAPADAHIRRMEARAYFARGAARSNRNLAKEAFSDFDRAVALIESLAVGEADPDAAGQLADCLHARGRARGNQGDAWGMRADIDRAVALETVGGVGS